MGCDVEKRVVARNLSRHIHKRATREVLGSASVSSRDVSFAPARHSRWRCPHARPVPEPDDPGGLVRAGPCHKWLSRFASETWRHTRRSEEHTSELQSLRHLV